MHTLESAFDAFGTDAEKALLPKVKLYTRLLNLIRLRVEDHELRSVITADLNKEFSDAYNAYHSVMKKERDYSNAYY